MLDAGALTPAIRELQRGWISAFIFAKLNHNLAMNEADLYPASDGRITDPAAPVLAAGAHR